MFCFCAGPKGDRRSEKDPRRSSALHHPQHHRAGQTQPGVPGPRQGGAAGGAGDPRPAAEHPQPEGGAGHQGRREARKEEEEEAEQPQPSELPEEEEERSADTAAAEGGAWKENEPTQETEKGQRGCCCGHQHIM